MKILAIEKEINNSSPGDFAKYAKEEAKILWNLYQNGLVREFYFRADKNAAVLLLEAENVTVAKEKLEELPFVGNKLLDFELIPLKPYPGFERLFG